MKLYFTPGTCSLAPHIILKETNTPFTAVKTDIRAKTVEDGSDFFKVNPNGYVPALMLDDGTVLTEASVIMQYIADKANATTLAPAAGSLARYKLMSWLSFVSTELHKGFAPLFNPKMPEEGRALIVERLQNRLAFVDKHLVTSRYLAGDEFTLPDAYLFAVLRWAPGQKIDLTALKNVSAYIEKIRARPAVSAAMKAEGLTT